MTGEKNTGFWNVKVVEDGLYEIRLRRWPQETDLAIDAALPPGAPVPGEKAFRERDGKAFAAVTATVHIGDLEKETALALGDKEATYKLKLTAGKTRLSGRFFGADGSWIGTYYAYIKKL